MFTEPMVEDIMLMQTVKAIQLKNKLHSQTNVDTLTILLQIELRVKMGYQNRNWGYLTTHTYTSNSAFNL